MFVEYTICKRDQGRRSIFRMGGGATVKNISNFSARIARNIYFDYARGARRKIKNGVYLVVFFILNLKEKSVTGLT